MTLELVLFVVLGSIFGSFGNVVVLRIKSGESLGGRSMCRSCKKTLGVLDLIPIFSYAFLGGKCRKCSAQISIQYPIVEILSSMLFALAALLFPSNLPLACLTAALLYFLLLASTFDALYQRLPDLFTYAIAVIAIVIDLLSGHLMDGVSGLLVSLLWFGGQWIISRGKAVGTGDLWLGMALGLWLGLQKTIAMLLLSYSVGAIVVLVLLGIGKLSFSRERIAFGPFLAIGAVLSFLGAGQMYFSIL